MALLAARAFVLSALSVVWMPTYWVVLLVFVSTQNCPGGFVLLGAVVLVAVVVAAGSWVPNCHLVALLLVYCFEQYYKLMIMFLKI